MANINNKKNLPIKSWLINIGVIVGIIFLVLYFYKWYEVKTDEKYLKSYLVSTGIVNKEMNDISEISSVLSETPNNYFVYISYTKDKTIYDLEKELKPLIVEYDLTDSFYYINVTDIKEKDSNYKVNVAKELNVDSNVLKTVPIILYFKDGKLIGNGAHNATDFENLLLDNDIKSL